MTQIKYISSQINELLQNKYVKNATKKHVVFTKECKLEAVKLYESWLTWKEVFQKLCFPEYIVNSDIPKNSLWRWKNNIKKWNIEFKKWRKIWFKASNKITLDNLSDKEKIEYLKTEVAYLRELYKEKHWFYP